MKKFLLGCIACATLVSAQAKVERRGKEWVEETSGTISSCQRLHVETAGGTVEVRGGASPEIAYRAVKRVQAANEVMARRKLLTATVWAKRSGSEAQLGVETQRHGSGVSTDFFITVPKSLLKSYIESSGGNLVMENLDGEAIGETAVGDIRADQIGGVARFSTVGGNLALGQIRGRLTAETAAGSINLREGLSEASLQASGGTITVENCARTVRAQSAGGDVTIRKCGGDVRVETAGGAIHLGVIEGIVVAETAGGTIDVVSARAVVRAGSASGTINLGRVFGPVRAETAVGNIVANVTANRASWGSSMLETNGGDVMVYLPADLAMTIKATIESATSRQAIHSDFPMVFRDMRDLPGLREVFGEAQVNGGGPVLMIRSTSGKIQIVKVVK